MKQVKHGMGVHTSFHNVTVNCSLEELKAVLGEPTYHTEDTTEKVQWDWNLITEDGRVFTIYDWKEYRHISDTEIIEWHIGARDFASSMEGKREIEAAIKQLTQFTLQIK